MKNKKIISIIFSLGILFILTGCLKDEIVLNDPQNFNRPLNLAAPIFNGHFSSQDLLDKIGDNEYLSVDSDGLLYIQVDTSTTTSYDEVVQFEDTLKLILPSYDLTTLKSTKAAFNYSDTIPVALIEDQRFDYLTIKYAMMEVTVNSPAEFTGSVKVSFPEITVDGNVLEFNNSLGGEYTDSENLTGGTLKFFQNSSNQSSFSIVVSGDVGTPTGAPSSTSLEVTIKMIDLEPEVVFGYFGSMDLIDQELEMDFDFFGDFDFTDMIQFEEIKMKLKTESEFGIPITVSIDSLVFINSQTGETADMGETVIVLNAADYGPPLSAAIDSTVIDLAAAINIAPDKVYYKVKGLINADGEIVNGDTVQNFLINDGLSSLTTFIDLYVPLWFKIDNYNRTDTISFDIREIVDSSTIDYLESIDLYFEFYNGFPFGINAQAYMVDEQGNLVDSLFSGDTQIWESPVIDANGIAGDSVLTDVQINLTHEKVKKLYDNSVVLIFIDSKVNSGSTQGSTEPSFVKLLDSYAIDMSLSIELKSGEINY